MIQIANSDNFVLDFIVTKINFQIKESVTRPVRKIITYHVLDDFLFCVNQTLSQLANNCSIDVVLKSDT